MMQKGLKTHFCPSTLSRRGDPTRTGDHLVPNQVRYQLRYTPRANHQIPVIRLQRYNKIFT